jgi:hypothetical protein
MRLLNISSVRSVLLSSVVTLAFLPGAGRAGTNMVSTSVVGGNTGWFTSPGTWKTNNGSGVGVGTAVVAPVAGNTYTLVSNATAIGNNQNETRTRNLYTNGTPVGLWTFPGDSLELTTNTEIRFKQIVTPATIETVNFPGVGGNPGLILNGGMLNVGDSIIQRVSGIMQAKPGTQSYLCPGNNDGASVDNGRAFNILAQIVGSGTLCIFEAGTNNAQQISSTNNTFSGLWLVKAGRLLGLAVGSLGTNSSFVIDPNYVLPVPPFSSTAPVVDVAGPAVLEAGYTLNSAGTLSLTNGGKMRLHQEVCFTAVNIHDPALSINTSLTPGIHYYAELITNYPNNFDLGGSGAVVVQPYGTPPPLPPQISTQPMPVMVYTNATARFSVLAADNGFPPLTYQWRRNGTNLTDGGNISGTTNSVLVVANASPADAAVTYDVIVANASFPVTSSEASLTLISTNGEAYEAAVKAAGPVAFYQLNETGDPSTNNTEAFDNVGSFNGIYGVGTQNGFLGINGPQATDSLPGFATGNHAVQTALSTLNSQVAVPAWNLNTNAVTITAWINPNGGQNGNEGLVFCRGGQTVAGLCYASPLGNNSLGYNWNNEPDTFNWDSKLLPPGGQWSLVALVVTPTSATIYMLNTSGLSSSTRAYNHVSLPFDGTTLIGNDSAGTAGNRSFTGIIDDVAVFNRALAQSEILALYSAASGVASFGPSIAVQPVATNVFQGQTVHFTGLAAGTEPLTYQWQTAPAGSGGPYANLTEGGQFSGTTTPTLTIQNVDLPNGADYVVLVSNSVSTALSSPATLIVNATSAPINITMTNQEPTGNDWDIGGITPGANTNWSDLNPASYSAASSPGNTYEVLAGARLRSPDGPVVSTFPGRKLTIDGDGVWNVNPGAGATIGEFRFKQHTYGTVNGVVNFTQLVMNGGQLDVGNDGMLIIGGRIDILTNTPINNDGNTDRGYRVDAQVNGSAGIEYHGYNVPAFQTAFSNNLNFTCTSNNFSGPWSVVTGTLLGTGSNALGTNRIIVGTNGAVETSYPLQNTNGYLVLNGPGKMYLHVTNVFRSVVVNGYGLTAGSNYSFTTLNTLFPTNFPATWTPHNGLTNSTGSGNIIVLGSASPLITTQPRSVTNRGQLNAQLSVVAVGATNLVYQWQAGAIGSGTFTNVTAGNATGATNATLSFTNLSSANQGDYQVIITNGFGSVTSSVATLGVLSAPFITLQPLSQTNSGTLTAQFFVSALGDLPLSFQWQGAPTNSGGPYTNLNNGGQISGATATNLTIANLNVGNTADYLVVISNAFGVVTSSIATLTVIDPFITSQPVSLSRFQTATAQFSVSELGTPPLTNQWQAAPAGSGGPYTNITDGGQISGSTTTTLTINNVDFPNQADYILVLKNASGVVTSTVASLFISNSLAAQNYTLDNPTSTNTPFPGFAIQQPNGDWNTVGNWNPDGDPSDVSAPARPGSTYTVVPGARLRTPAGATNSVFSGGSFTPGIELIVAGSGVWTNNPPTNYPTFPGPLIGEIRFKHANNNPATIFIKRLVMNGGQLDNGDNVVGSFAIQGEMDILANTPIYVDSAAANNRSYRIDSWLTGNGSIEWHDFDTSFGIPGGLTIAGTSNTFSGTWHVVRGVLIGSAANSLGTNAITVDNGGALETLYDLNNPSASLTLNGQMFLHQNDTFHAVTVGGAPIPPGTYSFAQLTASYPGNFPSSWPQQMASSFTTGSGSITVLTGPAILPVTMNFQVSGGNLAISGGNGIPNGHYFILSTTNVSLPRASWTRQGPNPFDGSGNFSTSIPVNINSPQQFFLLQQQVP